MARATGYECDFVEAVPKDIQTDCSICLLVLRQPYMVECCGNRFCKACLDEYLKVMTRCPLCKQTITAAIHDKQLQRCLKEKLVYCSNKSRGCTWTGELRQLEDGHLNVSQATPDEHGCQYVLVVCSQCKRIKVERHAMKDHMQKECPRRVVVCVHCTTHRAPFEDIGRIHNPVCPYVPVPCPKGCGAKPYRMNIETHLADRCPNNPLPCPFHIVGCSKKLTGSQMERHLRDRAVCSGHVSNVEKAIDTLKRKLGDKDKEVKTLRAELKDTAVLRRKVKEKDAQIHALEGDLAMKNSEVKNLMSEMKRKESDRRKIADHESRVINNLKAVLATKDVEIRKLEDETKSREEEVRDLKGQFNWMENVYKKEIDARKADVEEKVSLVSALTKEVSDKSAALNKCICSALRMQIRKKDVALKEKDSFVSALTKEVKAKDKKIKALNGEHLRNISELRQLQVQCHNESSLKQLRSENERFRRWNSILEAEIGDKISGIKKLENEARLKDTHADSLEKKIVKLQNTIQTQSRDIDMLTRTAKRRYEKLSEADKKVEREHKEQGLDGGYCTISKQTVPVVEENLNVPAHPLPDDTGLLGAALGVAVGAGIAVVAGIVRRAR